MVLRTDGAGKFTAWHEHCISYGGDFYCCQDRIREREDSLMPGLSNVFTFMHFSIWSGVINCLSRIKSLMLVFRSLASASKAFACSAPRKPDSRILSTPVAVTFC